MDASTAKRLVRDLSSGPVLILVDVSSDTGRWIVERLESHGFRVERRHGLPTAPSTRRSRRS